MVGRYPFRDPNRMRPEESFGNRRDREEVSGNRIDRPREREEVSGNRVDRPREQQGRGRRDRPQDEQQPAAPAPAAVLSPLPSTHIDMATMTASVEALIRLVTDSGIDELQVENGPFKLIVRCTSHQPGGERRASVLPVVLQSPVQAELAGVSPAVAEPVAAQPHHSPPLPTAPPGSASPELAPGEQVITSPMVGTFYDGPSPKDPPFVAEGDQVEPGQTVGIIEAMKMMNPIEAEVPGRITRILVRDGQPVEYGQPLMVLAAE